MTVRSSHTARRAALLAPLAVLGAACSNGGSDSPTAPAPTSALTATFDSAVAIQWHELPYARIRDTNLDPSRASRVFAYTGVTLYEIVVHGMPGHQSLQGQLNGLPAATLPEPVAGDVYDWAIAANRALNVVSSALVANSTAQFGAQETALLAALRPSRAWVSRSRTRSSRAGRRGPRAT